MNVRIERVLQQSDVHLPVKAVLSDRRGCTGDNSLVVALHLPILLKIICSHEKEINTKRPMPRPEALSNKLLATYGDKWMGSP